MAVRDSEGSCALLGGRLMTSHGCQTPMAVDLGRALPPRQLPADDLAVLRPGGRVDAPWGFRSAGSRLRGRRASVPDGARGARPPEHGAALRALTCGRAAAGAAGALRCRPAVSPGLRAASSPRVGDRSPGEAALLWNGRPDGSWCRSCKVLNRVDAGERHGRQQLFLLDLLTPAEPVLPVLTFGARREAVHGAPRRPRKPGKPVAAGG
eukprot:CAMPEP_0204608532 /NCGR_PEP_ID=MMETSP0661-20131031/60371_1 /ASSEMBLY_ACC=CAM_ASM_000606 /TAXON_ID=109239 /ORGANISM="Alexandrium margalefi, Strain AMGDE01CS-322" /LENGTH=208 /DNA_ID=CAMNT_0051620063 /DNA_START=46 /DNA_END=668 /DNA_ORIENTATION=-